VCDTLATVVSMRSCFTSCDTIVLPTRRDKSGGQRQGDAGPRTGRARQRIYVP
jgi:hypothetical protein